MKPSFAEAMDRVRQEYLDVPLKERKKRALLKKALQNMEKYYFG
jgi:hypothetical protein